VKRSLPRHPAARPRRRLRAGLARAGCLLLAALGSGTATAEDAGRADERRRMVRTQIEARGVTDARVLEALREVPRHLFVPEAVRDRAYEDGPLPIGHGQTISQPYIVAIMSELADLQPDERVLEIGTGCGYQAAVLSRLAREVYSIEIVEPLAESARARLGALGFDDVQVRHGDGYAGWPAKAPFDAIVVTAAPPSVPPALREQLAPDGRLVIPVGRRDQQLQVHRRSGDGFEVETVFPVRFVPMTGGGDD